MPDHMHESLLGRAMRDAAIGMCLVAVDGTITEANAAACEFFGLDATTLSTRTWQELTHPDDIAIDLAHVDALIRGERDSYRLSKRYLRPDGSERVGELSVSAIRDESGAVDYFVSQIIDVTSERRAVAALAESEERFHLMFQRSTDLVTVLDADRTIRWLSPSALAALGAPADDYIGTSVLDHVHPDDVAVIQTTSADTGPDATIRFRHRLRRADGTYRWFETSIVNDPAQDGENRLRFSSSRDIHDAVLAEQEVARSQALLRGVLDTMLDPWVLLDPLRDATGRIVDFVYVDANQAACAANRLTREQLLGMRLLELLPEHEPRGLLAAYADVVESGFPLALDDDPFPDRDDPGRIRRFDNRAVAIDGQLSFTWREVTDRYEARRVLARQAHHDDLTGLPNRARLRERLQTVFSRAPRTGQEIAVLYCDLDDFKPINDAYGHAVGDTVLREVGARIAASVRMQDTVARLGGDEFVAVLEGVHAAEDAIAVADKVRAAVTEPIIVDDGPVTTSLSIGVALASPGDDPESTLRAADVALYRAKALGRNRVVVYEDDTAA